MKGGKKPSPGKKPEAKPKAKEEPRFKSISEGLDKAVEQVKIAEKTAAKVGVQKKLGLPSFRKVATTEAKQEEAEELRGWINEVPSRMADYVSRFWKCVTGDAIHFEQFRTEFAEVMEALEECLNPGAKIAKDAAHEAYALAMAENVPAARWALLSLVTGSLQHVQGFPTLTGLGFLTEAKPETKLGPTVIQFLGRVYSVTGKNAKRIAMILSGKAEEAREANRDHYRKMVAEITGQSDPTFTVEKLIAGEPSESFTLPVADSPNARDGGYVRIKSDGKSVTALEAIGNISRRMNEIISREEPRSVGVCTLTWDNLTQPKTMLYPEYQDTRFLWDVLKRGISTIKKMDENLKKMEQHKEEREKERAAFRAACDAECKALAEKATASPMDWFLKNEPGITLVDLSEIGNPWKFMDAGKDAVAWRVAFLMERDEDGKIRIGEYPERLKDLFSNAKLLEFTDPKERFDGLQYPLSAMLKKVYGHCLTQQREEENRRKDEETKKQTKAPSKSEAKSK